TRVKAAEYAERLTQQAPLDDSPGVPGLPARTIDCLGQIHYSPHYYRTVHENNGVSHPHRHLLRTGLAPASGAGAKHLFRATTAPGKPGGSVQYRHPPAPGRG